MACSWRCLRVASRLTGVSRAGGDSCIGGAFTHIARDEGMLDGHDKNLRGYSMTHTTTFPSRVRNGAGLGHEWQIKGCSRAAGATRSWCDAGCVACGVWGVGCRARWSVVECGGVSWSACQRSPRGVSSSSSTARRTPCTHRRLRRAQRVATKCEDEWRPGAKTGAENACPKRSPLWVANSWAHLTTTI